MIWLWVLRMRLRLLFARRTKERAAALVLLRTCALCRRALRKDEGILGVALAACELGRCQVEIARILAE